MEVISVCIPSHNTLSKGDEVLERTINSISNAIKFFYSHNNEVKVIISWVDDASTDGTVDEVRRLRNLQDSRIKDNFFITPINVNRGQAYCRNLAAGLYNSDYICLFDSDDEMYENHLSVCHALMDAKDSSGKKFAIGSTSIDTSEKDIHPYWLEAMSNSVPNTKIIRRDVWEFVEGMPTDFIYRKIGEEDVAFVRIVYRFFEFILYSKSTSKYWNYPGSNFDMQIEKFRTDPAKYVEKYTKVAKDLLPIRDQILTRKIEYLEQKFIIYNLYDKFDNLMTKFQPQDVENKIL